jgi:hypothetical protein
MVPGPMFVQDGSARTQAAARARAHAEEGVRSLIHERMARHHGAVNSGAPMR